MLESSKIFPIEQFPLAELSPLANQKRTLPENRIRFDQVRMNASRLEGQRHVIAKNAEELSDKVSHAKGRLLCAEEISNVFKEMQRRAHSRAVSTFEDLLTAVLQDVLPNEGSISLALDMKGNSATLDVNLVNKNGFATDVLKSNGGAVTNVVCAGLRFAALSRTSNRKFMVLDEPDCWLKPDLVPSFMKVISDVAIQTGTQTLFVSHYSLESFGDEINRIHLTRGEDGKICAAAIEPISSKWENDSDEGIRAVELINFEGHEHTLIPCFPGATALIGDNNLGKSAALVRSFKAVAHNDSGDDCIKHGASSAKIIIHLEDNQRLVWTREPKRNPVVFYEWFKGEDLIADGRPPSRNSVPDWVTDLLGIGCIDGLDLQLSSQKSPVFLLNESPSVRAQLLTVGRESSHVANLMSRYDDLKKADRALTKSGESQLTKLFEKLTCADKLDETDIQITKAVKILENLEARNIEVGNIHDLEYEITELHAEIKALETSAAFLNVLPTAPQLCDQRQLSDSINKIEKSSRHSLIGGMWEMIEPPVLREMTNIAAIGKRIVNFDKNAHLLPILNSGINEIYAPILKSVDTINFTINKLETLITSIENTQVALDEINLSLIQAKSENDHFLHSIGDQCPLCGAEHNNSESFAKPDPLASNETPKIKEELRLPTKKIFRKM